MFPLRTVLPQIWTVSPRPMGLDVLADRAVEDEELRRALGLDAAGHPGAGVDEDGLGLLALDVTANHRPPVDWK